MTNKLLLDKIDQIVACLVLPLAAEDLKEGWNEALQVRWQTYFKDIRFKLENSISLRGNESNPTWGLAQQGIENGALADRIAQISMLLPKGN